MSTFLSIYEKGLVAPGAARGCSQALPMTISCHPRHGAHAGQVFFLEDSASQNLWAPGADEWQT